MHPTGSMATLMKCASIPKFAVRPTFAPTCTHTARHLIQATSRRITTSMTRRTHCQTMHPLLRLAQLSQRQARLRGATLRRLVTPLPFTVKPSSPFLVRTSLVAAGGLCLRALAALMRLLLLAAVAAVAAGAPTAGPVVVAGPAACAHSPIQQSHQEAHSLLLLAVVDIAASTDQITLNISVVTVLHQFLDPRQLSVVVMAV
ncbi:unannotated protein [freshwater metagenome]|uniref:Unannotated protein n=1 Tax=freshwater metagenome TaxID=449393 RepID=A0A6J6H3M3_9ZZZZ